MTTKIHDYKDSVKVGTKGEDLISEYFQNRYFEVTRATKHQQLNEHWDLRIDKGDVRYFIEVKTEPTAEKTRNFFWEVSVGNKVGWTKKYSEDTLDVWIVWLLPDSRVFYALPSSRLEWISKIVENAFPKRIVQNTSYTAEGYLVPISFIDTKATQYSLD
jgi:hypothetical protein